MHWTRHVRHVRHVCLIDLPPFDCWPVTTFSIAIDIACFDINECRNCGPSSFIFVYPSQFSIPNLWWLTHHLPKGADLVDPIWERSPPHCLEGLEPNWFQSIESTVQFDQGPQWHCHTLKRLSTSIKIHIPDSFMLTNEEKRKCNIRNFVQWCRWFSCTTFVKIKSPKCYGFYGCRSRARRTAYFSPIKRGENSRLYVNADASTDAYTLGSMSLWS